MFEDVEEVRPDGEQPLHYYYNRNDRIKNAPQIVQDYYAGKMKTPRGFKVLFNKQNRFVLFALVLVVSFGWGYSGLSKTKAYTQVAGINFEMSSFSYEDVVYVSIKMFRSKKSKETKPVMVNANIMSIEPNKQINEKQELSFIYEEGEHYFRAKFSDFDIIRTDAVIRIGDEEKTVTAEVKR